LPCQAPIARRVVVCHLLVPPVQFDWATDLPQTCLMQPRT
jgi:hypothetical protein